MDAVGGVAVDVLLGVEVEGKLMVMVDRHGRRGYDRRCRFHQPRDRDHSSEEK